MAWIYLLFAGLSEIAWPVGLKLAQSESLRWGGILIAVLGIATSGGFLFLAQRDLPMGTAYAVWTGIGSAGAFLVGIMVFAEPSHWLRWFSVMLIILGVIGLKLSHE